MPRRGGEVGFAGAGRAEQHDVAGLGQEPAGGQRGDLLPDRRVGRPSRSPRGSWRAANPAALMRSWAPEALRADDLAFEHGGEVVLVGPAGVAGLVGQAGRRPR